MLQELGRRVGETVHLALLDGPAVVFLDSVESSRAARVTTRAAMSMPAHCTAAGKVLLADLTDDDLRRRLGPEPLPGRTPNSHVTWEQVHRDLRRIRAAGYATNFAESERGVSAVACAVPQRDGREPLSVLVSVPAGTIDSDRTRDLADAARAAAHKVAARLPPLRPSRCG